MTAEMSVNEADPELSIVIPVFNEERSIGATLDAVAKLRGRVEVIAVDGGSDDGTLDVLRGRGGVRVIESDRGRGAQLHAGACAARGDVIWFLHADTFPAAPDAAERIAEAMTDSGVAGGNFSIIFGGGSRSARFLTWLYPQLRKLGLCYGDSGIFVRRDAYARVGGFKPYPLFEDLDLVRGLKRAGRMAHLRSTVVTSSRRFENRSFTITFARWSALQILYWLGVHPERLGRMYYPARRRRTEGRDVASERVD